MITRMLACVFLSFFVMVIVVEASSRIRLGRHQHVMAPDPNAECMGYQVVGASNDPVPDDYIFPHPAPGPGRPMMCTCHYYSNIQEDKAELK